jgi:hypothetical protein
LRDAPEPLVPILLRRIDARVDRIGHRLDLIDAPAG